ncbi:hypothetical protein EDB83DRAFT_2583229 [Lactarius deliciosus]|nr:hypothetical protein EDB83DRAFT_2583229 [Lactarius deliciosus]
MSCISNLKQSVICVSIRAAKCARVTYQQAVQNTDVILGIVAGASEATLERNAFYVGLKAMASNRAIEIEALKGTVDQKTQEIVGRDKEIDILKARCETLEGAIDRFARDYHTLKDAGGGDVGGVTFLTDLGPMPAPWKRNESPEVTIWIKREFVLAAAKAKAQKGESSGDPSDATKTKGKAGRPSKKAEEKEGHKFIFLQRRDGTMISVETLRKMSEKARLVWDFLLEKKMATPQFCKLGWSARDLYTRAMLTDPEFNFLLLCDDATWKLREWSIQNYPGWAGNRGLRPKNTDENADKNEDVLDDPALVRMQSSDGTDDFNSGIEPADHVSENDDTGIEETTVPHPDDDSEENPSPSTQSPRGPVVPEENPGPSIQSSRGPVQSVIANPFAPTVSSTSSGTHTEVTTTNTTIAPASSAPAQTSEDAATTTQAHAATNNMLGRASTVETTETHTDSDDPGPSRPIGTTPPGGSDPATTTNGAIPPQCRIKFTAHPQADTTVAQGNLDPVAPPVPSEPTQTLAAGPSDSQTPVPVQPITAPTDTPIPNLRLERAMANAEKKRKAEGNSKTAAATSKKQKTATALAEPTGTITIKNICMRQWNEKQPGGQGLAADFDTYFKGLSDTDKERFKTEMRIAQAAVRKAKTAAKKRGEVPSAN